MPDAGLEATLHCRTCGREWTHLAQRIHLEIHALDLKKVYGEDARAVNLLDEVVCPGCGSTDRPDFTGESNLRMLAEAAILRAGGPLTVGRYGQPVISVGHMQLEDGSRLPPLLMLRRFEEELERDPADIPLRMRYANLLRNFLRLQGAKAQFQEVLRRFPSHMEALANLANITGVLGELQQSAEYCQSALEAMELSRLPEAERFLWKKYLLEHRRRLREGLRILPALSGEMVVSSPSAGRHAGNQKTRKRRPGKSR